jgi:hypothetical protein
LVADRGVAGIRAVRVRARFLVPRAWNLRSGLGSAGARRDPVGEASGVYERTGGGQS